MRMMELSTGQFVFAGSVFLSEAPPIARMNVVFAVAFQNLHYMAREASSTLPS
jgi:hypothetical protein